MFQVRIVTVDHYMSTPIPGLDISYSEFRKSAIKQVPVIRIFGTTPTGEKTCVHVHGVFPYICIPYDGSEPHLKLSYQLAASLDKAINIASGYSSSNIQHVYKVVLVSGVPFHGYHRNKHQYLKVYFYKPSVVKQAVSLLQNGAIMNKVYQPHEAHISFILQFFIDFNLYGMSFIDFCSVNYRQTNFPELLAKLPHDSFVPETIPAMSCSQYEVDVAAADISNCPSSQGNGQLNNPGIGAIWEDERRRRSMTPGTPLPIPQLHSQRPPLKPTASEIFFLRRLEGIINSASQEDNSGEPVSNKSYAMEEPTNNPALDASFVSLHATEVYPQQPIVDTIVNEDLALQNSPSSQRLLDKSLALDHDDFELLDVLEALAVTGPAAVDDDSVLGSQTVRANPADEDTSDDSGEDEKWQDRTIVPEEDNVLQLFDLSLPNIDENPALYNLIHEPQPGPSGLQHNNVESKIPQVDGTSHCPKKPGAPRMKKRIPQVDGLSDLKKNPGRKSLGMRGGLSHASKASTSREKYRPGGGLIFQTRKTVDQSTAAAPELIEPTQSVLSFPNIISSLEVGRADVDTHSLPPNTPLGSGNPIQTEPSEVANFSQSTVQNTLDQEDLAGLLPFSEVFIGPSSIVNSEPPGEEIIPYFPVDVPLQTSAGCKDCGGDGHGAINDDQTNLASSTIVEKADSFHGSTRLSKENKLEVSSIPSCKPSEVAGYVSSVRPSADLEDSKPTGIPNTMYGEISKSLARGPSNNDASCSDSKMNCLSEALENDPMEDILPTGSEEFSSQPATSRREELLAFVDKQKEIEEQTETDPVTDAPRQRYSKSPCNLCYTPHKASARKPTKNKKRKAKPFNFRMLCSVQLVKLTLANLYDVCQEHQVVYIGRNF